MARTIPYPAPDGRRWQATLSDGWRPVSGKRCRRQGAGHKACTNQAIIELNRGVRYNPGGRRDSWWAYCLEHAYGNWLEDGKVWHWRLVANAEVNR